MGETHMSDLAILKLAEGLARHASGRHALVAQNIANADTPGYRARDLPPFEAVLNDAYAARATRQTHFNAGGAHAYEPRRDTAFGAASPNGNDVSLPEQLARATDAMATQDKAMTIYGKTLDILRLGLGRR